VCGGKKTYIPFTYGKYLTQLLIEKHKVECKKKERFTDRKEITICKLLFYSEAVPMLYGNLCKTEEHPV